MNALKNLFSDNNKSSTEANSSKRTRNALDVDADKNNNCMHNN